MSIRADAPISDAYTNNQEDGRNTCKIIMQLFHQYNKFCIFTLQLIATAVLQLQGSYKFDPNTFGRRLMYDGKLYSYLRHVGIK